MKCKVWWRHAEIVELPTQTLVHLRTNDTGLQIYKHSPGHVLAGIGLTEEGVEGVRLAPNGGVAGHLAVRLDAVLKAVQLPAGIAHLDSGLADVDWNYFSLQTNGRIITVLGESF